MVKKREEAREWALAAAQAALDKKALEVVLINVGPALVIVDYFVLASADNPRQLSAIVDEVEKQLRERFDVRPIGREGMEKRDWVLLDYGDFVVHVFDPATREFYRLETLYNDAEITPINE